MMDEIDMKALTLKEHKNLQQKAAHYEKVGTVSIEIPNTHALSVLAEFFSSTSAPAVIEVPRNFNLRKLAAKLAESGYVINGNVSLGFRVASLQMLMNQAG